MEISLLWPSEHRMDPSTYVPHPTCNDCKVYCDCWLPQLQGYYLSWKMMSLWITSSSSCILCVCVSRGNNCMRNRGCGGDTITLPRYYHLPPGLSSCGGSNINEVFAGHCLRHLGLEGEEERFVILKNPISLNHHNILPQKGLSDLAWLLYLSKNWSALVYAYCVCRELR